MRIAVLCSSKSCVGNWWSYLSHAGDNTACVVLLGSWLGLPWKLESVLFMMIYIAMIIRISLEILVFINGVPCDKNV